MNLLTPSRFAKRFFHLLSGLSRWSLPGQPLLHYSWTCAWAAYRVEPQCVFNVQGILLSARPTDIVALEEVLLRNEYASALALLRTAGTSPVVVDLGANIGAVSAYALALHPGARVTSVEAGPDTFALLEANRAANPRLAWTTIHAAAAGEVGTRRFSCNALSTSGRVARGGDGVEVRALPLSQLMPPGEVALLKVDIEGAEEDLLRGGEEDLARVNALIIELHPGLCDTSACEAIIRRSFPRIETVKGRVSSKPVLLATR